MGKYITPAQLPDSYKNNHQVFFSPAHVLWSFHFPKMSKMSF